MDYRLGWGTFLNFIGRAKYSQFATALNTRNPMSKGMVDAQRKKYGDRFPARQLCASKPEPWGFRAQDLLVAGINTMDVDPHMLPHSFYFLKKHVFKHPNHSSYYFTMPEKYYFVPQGPYRSLEDAREVRVSQALRKYADWFGDVRGAAVAWYTLAAESHDAAAKNTAKHNASKLGMISSSGHLIEK